ncbi:ComEC/Rec2 family competence protein [Microbacterium sp. bgisy189]|uniref:ComEC/Rec2 family competence protein n=1 Tax=Microbacterium sp. bgisy189 TaxID=3413798 RepID=UPI003EB83AC6
MSGRRARRRDVRLLIVVAVAWPAAIAAIVLPEAAPVLAAALGVTMIGLLFLARTRPEPARTVAVLVAVGCAVGAAVAVHVSSTLPSRGEATALLVDGGSAELTAIVVGKVDRYGDRWAFDAATVVIDGGQGAEARLSAPVQVIVSDPPDTVDVGARVRIRGTGQPLRPGDRAVSRVIADRIEVEAGPVGILETAAALRNGLSDVTAGLPAPASGLVAGLAVGDTSNVTTELDTRMQDASLSHLTAVSGANCALVVAIAFFAAAACGFGRRMRVVFALGALAGFVVLVTPEPSVVRAATMSAIAMLGILLGRVGAGVSLLSTAIIGALVLDPWLALSLGFALSASATAALLLLAGPLAAGLERWLPTPLAIALSVPVAAQLACGPLLVLLTPSIPVYGVIANLLAAPAAPIATIVGLAACLLSGVPLLGAGLATLAWVPAAWITGVANVFATLPGALLPWWSGPVGLLVLLGAGGAVAGVLMGRARRTSATVLALLCAVLIAMGPVSRMVDRTRVPASWSIAACAVGQGDALLIRSAEHIALVDTGPDEASLGRCLDRFGIEKIDLLVLTHFDLDHAGGAATVIGDVATVLHGPVADPDDDALLAAFESAGAALHAVKPGTSGPLGDATWRALWPSADTPPGNDASVVIEVSGGGLPRTLFLGDLAARPQARVAGALSGTYDVVKVAHHGSADQYPPVYTNVQPRLALVTVGENTHGHPRDETLKVLEAAGASIARTDTEGDIAVWTDGGALNIWRSRPLPGVGADR